jgi:hypothetical protein
MTINDMLDALVAGIRTVVPATRDPAVLLAMVAQDPVVAFVDAPTVTPAAQSGSAVLSVPVHVVMRPPAGEYDLRPVLDVLPDLIRNLAPNGDIAPETLRVGDQTLPGYQLTVRGRTDC